MASTDHHDDATTPATEPPVDRQSVVAREKERFGGVKPGVAFFGWLTATGMGVLLTALVAAIEIGRAHV